MAYIDDIATATETIDDHLVRLREIIEYLREAGFKMRVAKCDFMKSEIKYRGRVASAEGIKPDPKAVSKLRDWEVPRNKTELQSFLDFAKYYREFIPWHAKLVAPLHAITGQGATSAWGDEQQQAFNSTKLALIEATTLAQPVSEGELVLDNDAFASMSISGILHQWQGPSGERRLRPIVYGSKKLNATQAKDGAPKLELYAAYYFILKNHSYLCPRKVTLRVDNQALAWLKTYSTDQAYICRWIMALEKYHFKMENRPRIQHRNADGLSKRLKNSSRKCHLLRTNGNFYHRRNLNSYLLHLGSTCMVECYPITTFFLLTCETLNQTPKTQFSESHDDASAVRQLRKGRERCTLLYLRHQCLHCKHTKTFIQIIPRTGLTSQRKPGKITCYLRMWQMFPHV